MRKISAGLLIYNHNRILLVHPGGPYWQDRDEGAWSIPKGEVEQGESYLETAKRECEEELGQELNGEITHDLGKFKQSKHKDVVAFVFKGNVSLPIKSNEIEIQWPSNSGKIITIPEVDKAEWFSPETALKKINKGQKQIIEKFLYSQEEKK